MRILYSRLKKKYLYWEIPGSIATINFDLLGLATGVVIECFIIIAIDIIIIIIINFSYLDLFIFVFFI